MTDSPALQAIAKSLQDQAHKTLEDLIETRAQAYMTHPEQLDMLEKPTIPGHEISTKQVWLARNAVNVLYINALTFRRPYGSETILINLKAASRMLARLGDSDLPVREAIKEFVK